MLNNNKQLIIFAAPSGSGKSSLIKKIIETSNNRAQLSVSATTRLPREGEIHGKDYFFISHDEFKSLQKNDAFIESAEVHGFMYGTLTCGGINTTTSPYSGSADNPKVPPILLTFRP